MYKHSRPDWKVYLKLRHQHVKWMCFHCLISKNLKSFWVYFILSVVQMLTWLRVIKATRRELQLESPFLQDTSFHNKRHENPPFDNLRRFGTRMYLSRYFMLKSLGIYSLGSFDTVASLARILWGGTLLRHSWNHIGSTWQRFLLQGILLKGFCVLLYECGLLCGTSYRCQWLNKTKSKRVISRD